MAVFAAVEGRTKGDIYLSSIFPYNFDPVRVDVEDGFWVSVPMTSRRISTCN